MFRLEITSVTRLFNQPGHQREAIGIPHMCQKPRFYFHLQMTPLGIPDKTIPKWNITIFIIAISDSLHKVIESVLSKEITGEEHHEPGANETELV